MGKRTGELTAPRGACPQLLRRSILQLRLFRRAPADTLKRNEVFISRGAR